MMGAETTSFIIVLICFMNSCQSSSYPADLHLRVFFESNKSGYILNPDWSVESYSENGVVELQVPANHFVVVSVPVMKLSYVHDWLNKLELYTIDVKVQNNEEEEEEEEERLVWTTVGTQHPPVKLFTARRFRVLFIPDRMNYDLSTFKLLFSYHSKSALPEQLENGKWNCSVPFWPEFQQHLRCNLQEECKNGEDEMDCPYQSAFCGADLISAVGGCYRYIPTEEKRSWNDAAKICRQEGGQIVSLNTPEEWRAISELLVKFNFEGIFLGLSCRSVIKYGLYRNIWEWSDGSMGYFYFSTGRFTNTAKYSFILQSKFDTDTNVYMTSEYVGYEQFNILCEIDLVSVNASYTDPAKSGIKLPLVSDDVEFGLPMTTCPKGHKTHAFLACDESSSCWSRGYGAAVTCNAPLTPLPPSFTCNNGVQQVPYTFVCDHRADCSDNSDENFCVFQPCNDDDMTNCGNQQCLLYDQRCDGVEDCANSADERWCSASLTHQTPLADLSAALYLDGRGDFTMSPLTPASPHCPNDTFQCQTSFYCLPVYMRCNGLNDCPGHEDEAGCDSYSCPGVYRCRDATFCLHPSFICDGIKQCPLHDDELMCDFRCPVNCTCYGLAMFCQYTFPIEDYPELRYIDAKGTGFSLVNMFNNSMLVHVGLAQCRIREFVSPILPNLRSLDLSKNLLKSVSADVFKNLPNLKDLTLDRNPLSAIFLVDITPQHQVSSLQSLSLSQVFLSRVRTSLLEVFPKLQHLNLSGCRIEEIAGTGFSQRLNQIIVLDLRGSPMSSFPEHGFQELESLHEIFADNYKACCQEMLPEGFNLVNCHAPIDEISSCEALLRSDAYRVVLSVFAALALVGNLGSFIYRVGVTKDRSSSGFAVFVTHLCLADFLMGVYLAIVGVADRVFFGSYLSQDVAWKTSAACRAAGFLSLLSSEVSAFLICLITLDRFLVLRFPFSQMHFRKKSAHVACGVAWMLGVVLAAVPLLPFTSHWQFYSQNGLCIPLPIPRSSFSGHGYSFSVMIVLNFVLFLCIAAGQASIYYSVRVNSIGDLNQSQDSAIARRLITIAMSDFLCWFPIGVLGLLASSGTPIPSEVNVVMAIFVLPLNSALNPFLYTLNMVLDRRNRARENKIKQMILSAQRSEMKDTPFKSIV